MNPLIDFGPTGNLKGRGVGSLANHIQVGERAFIFIVCVGELLYGENNNENKC